jgi:hypothetical protein
MGGIEHGQSGEAQTPEGWPVYSENRPVIVLFVFRRRETGSTALKAKAFNLTSAQGVVCMAPPKNKKKETFEGRLDYKRATPPGFEKIPPKP